MRTPVKTAPSNGNLCAVLVENGLAEKTNRNVHSLSASCAQQTVTVTAMVPEKVIVIVIVITIATILVIVYNSSSSSSSSS